MLWQGRHRPRGCADPLSAGKNIVHATRESVTMPQGILSGFMIHAFTFALAFTQLVPNLWQFLEKSAKILVNNRILKIVLKTFDLILKSRLLFFFYTAHQLFDIAGANCRICCLFSCWFGWLFLVIFRFPFQFVCKDCKNWMVYTDKAGLELQKIVDMLVFDAFLISSSLIFLIFMRKIRKLINFGGKVPQL